MMYSRARVRLQNLAWFLIPRSLKQSISELHQPTKTVSPINRIPSDLLVWSFHPISASQHILSLFLLSFALFQNLCFQNSIFSFIIHLPANFKLWRVNVWHTTHKLIFPFMHSRIVGLSRTLYLHSDHMQSFHRDQSKRPGL